MLKGVDIQHDLVTCKYTWLEMACSIVREGGGGAGLGELEGRGGPGHPAGAATTSRGPGTALHDGST